MDREENLLFLAEYIEGGLDLEAASILDHELHHHPEAVLFLMNYCHTLLFYKRHQNNEEMGWIVTYLEKRIPGSLRELVEDLPYKRSRRPMTKAGLTS